MESEVEGRPSAGVARIKLGAGEAVTCEVGSMIAMTSGLTVETTSQQRGGGLTQGVKRVFGGESFFLNHFTANEADQAVLVAPKLLGDIVPHQLDGGSLIVQGTSWLASGPDIAIDATWQGFASALFSGEGIFWVKCSGTGDVLINSFGALYEVDVDGEYVVDTGHIAAFEETLSFDIRKAGESWLGSFLGGEALVCKFSGQGKLYCQSHNPPTFGKLLGPKLKPRQS